MFMIKRMDKKGQEGFTLVNLIIALLVLVVIAGGIFYVYQRGKDVAENVPSKVEFIIQSCVLVASEQTVESYCNQIREIGNNKYVTCDVAVTQENLNIENSDVMDPLCSVQESARKSSIQRQIAERKIKSSSEINGKSVDFWTLVETIDKAKAKCTKVGDEIEYGKNLDAVNVHTCVKGDGSIPFE